MSSLGLFREFSPVRRVLTQIIYLQIGDLRIDQIQITKVQGAGNDLDPYPRDTFIDEIQYLGGARRYVNDSFPMARPTVRYAYDGAFHVRQVRNPEEGPEGIRTMRGYQLLLVMDPSAGRFPAMETMVVIRSKSFLLRPYPLSTPEHERQKEYVRQAEGHVCFLLLKRFSVIFSVQGL